MTTVHKVLPHAVSSVLSIERFQSQPSHVCVLEIITKVSLEFNVFCLFNNNIYCVTVNRSELYLHFYIAGKSGYIIFCPMTRTCFPNLYFAQILTLLIIFYIIIENKE